MRGPLAILITVFVLLGAVVVAVFFPWGSSIPTTSDGAEKTEELPVLAEARDPVDSISDPTEADEASTQRDEIVRGHQVQVIGPDGNPATGIKVQWWVQENESGEEILNHFRENPTAISWMRGASASQQSDESGRVVIPTLAPCMAGVCEQGLYGHLVCAAEPEGSEPELHVLQLRVVPMVELIVRDANGNPVDEGFRFHAKVASAAAAEELPGNASGWDRDQVWIYHSNQIGKIGDGRTMMVMIPAPRAIPRLGEAPQPLRFRVGLEFGLSELPVHEFGIDEVGPLIFQLPGTGRLALQLVDFPAHSFPALNLVTDDEARVPYSSAYTRSEDDGWFEFDQVPLGREFDMEILVGVGADPQAGRGRTRLPKQRVAGPVLPGERVEHQLTFQYPPGFHGRFVFPPEMTVPVERFILDSNRGYGRANAFLECGDHARLWINAFVFSDGTFILPSHPNASGGTLNTACLTGVGFEWIEPPPRSAADREDWRGSRYWAFTEAHLPSPDATVDLGEVQLMDTDPLLKVRVVDEAEQPLAGASVQLSFLSEKSERSGQLDRFENGQSRGASTDGMGEAWFLDRDWYTEFGAFPPDSPSPRSVSIRKIRVEASHPQAVTRSTEIALTTREVVIQLKRAGSITGSIQPLEGLRYIDVSVVPVGGLIKERSTTGVGSEFVDFRAATLPPAVSFKLTSVPAGTWDVLFSLRELGTREVLRVENVVFYGGVAGEDSRLQNLDLSPFVGLLRLRLRDQNGRPLGKADGDEFSPRMSFHKPGGGTMTGRANWVGSEIVVPLSRQTPATLTLRAEGWKAVRLEEVLPSLQDITMHRYAASEIHIVGFGALPEGSELTMNVSMHSSHDAQFILEKVGSVRQVVRWPGAGDYTIFWSVRNRAAGWREASASQVSVSEEALDALTLLEIPIPQELLARLPR